LERSVQLNHAWRTLSQPVARAEYLLSLQGVGVGASPGEDWPDDTSNRATQPVDTALLVEVMELRETLAEARIHGDSAKIATLIVDVRGRHDREVSAVAAGFADASPNTTAIAGHLVAARYYRRFLEEAGGENEEGVDR
jgi:molecular chaperone HscB